MFDLIVTSGGTFASSLPTGAAPSIETTHPRLRLMYRSLGALLLAGIMFIAAIPALGAEKDGQRIKSPGGRDIAVTFPSDWEVMVHEIRGRGGGGDRVLLTATGMDWAATDPFAGYQECELRDFTVEAKSPPAYQSVGDYLNMAGWAISMMGADELAADIDTQLMDLPAGEVGCMDVAVELSPGFIVEMRSYIFTDGKTWFDLMCTSAGAPDDRWLSIAETFRFKSPGGRR